VFLTQKEFFGNSPEYINWVLEALELQGKISPNKRKPNQEGLITVGIMPLLVIFQLIAL
jgi:CRISPR-associated protein Csc3